MRLLVAGYSQQPVVKLQYDPEKRSLNRNECLDLMAHAVANSLEQLASALLLSALKFDFGRQREIFLRR